MYNRAARKVISEVKKHNIPIIEGVENNYSAYVLLSLVRILGTDKGTTMRGFLDIVYHEWINGSYPFTTSEELSQHAPYFEVFLNCLWCFLESSPNSFEV